ncbi:MAG TPA: hypothetical protein VLA92_04735, partial [Candidatus Saccharimonadales bacterium]|nr:hypothetical protein [Candidatus Saccharimonadales bacterium]
MKTTEVQAWAQDKPGVVEFLHRLNEASIEWALFSGTVARPYTSDDVDILVSRSGFDAMRSLVPHKALHQNKQIHITSGDGIGLHMETDEIVYPIGNTEVQALRPATITGTHGHNYFMSLTPAARAARKQHVVDGVVIHEASPFDTILIKSIMQRGLRQNKCDGIDLATVANGYDWDDSYTQRRTTESNYDARADTFLQMHT